MTVTTERIRGAVVVNLQGTMDLATRDDVDHVLHAAVEGADALVVDLDGVDFLSSVAPKNR